MTNLLKNLKPFLIEAGIIALATIGAFGLIRILGFGTENPWFVLLFLLVLTTVISLIIRVGKLYD